MSPRGRSGQLQRIADGDDVRVGARRGDVDRWERRHRDFVQDDGVEAALPQAPVHVHLAERRGNHLGPVEEAPLEVAELLIHVRDLSAEQFNCGS